MSTPVSTPEPEIRSLIGEWTEALRAKDVARRTAHYADDGVPRTRLEVVM